MFISLIHLEDSEGFAKKSIGRVALISPEEVKVVVLVDMFVGLTGGLVAGGIIVTGVSGIGVCIRILGVTEEVTTASRGFLGFGSGTMLLGFRPSWKYCQ